MMIIYLGREATDHLLPSAFLMFTKANCDGETFGESEHKNIYCGGFGFGVNKRKGDRGCG